MRMLLTIAILLGTVAIALGNTPAAEPDWQIIQRLFQLDRTLPHTGQGEGPLREQREYLFDQFANMDAAVFRNGLTFVLQKYPPPEDTASLPAYQQDMGYKLRVLFEYYPLAARERSDFEALVDLIYHGRQPDVLRVFLVRHLGPGLEPPSTFGTYMQSHALKDQEAFDKRLRELVQLPQESAPVQVAAIDALLARTEAGYATLLAHDGLAASRPAADNVIHIRQFIDNPEAIALSQRTQQLIKEKGVQIGTWAESLRSLADNQQRHGAVREKAKEALAVILANYPIPNREKLQPKS